MILTPINERIIFFQKDCKVYAKLKYKPSYLFSKFDKMVPLELEDIERLVDFIQTTQLTVFRIYIERIFPICMDNTDEEINRKMLKKGTFISTI